MLCALGRPGRAERLATCCHRRGCWPASMGEGSPNVGTGPIVGRVVVLTVVDVVAGVESPVVDDVAVGGPCARCGSPSGRISVADVVSRVFTGTDRWIHPAGRSLCGVCAWAYSAPRAREAIRCVSRAPAAVRELTLAQAYAQLSGGGLEASLALVIPIRPGRRHLLPQAQWGRIVTDHGCFTWSSTDADRLLAVHRLHGAGIPAAALMGAAAPWLVIDRARSSGQLAQTLNDWELLKPWRAGSMHPWLALAQRLTYGGGRP